MTNIQFHLLLVDDDPILIESVKLILPKHWKVIAVQDPANINYHFMYHAAFVDMHLTPDHTKAEGPRVIDKLKQAHPHLDIVAMSGDPSRELMEKCLKVGANKFLSKPLMPEELISILEKVEAQWFLKSPSQHLQNRTQWIGSGTKSKQIQQKIASLRGEYGPILIEGETGTGKEITALLLNQQENNRPFITVNLAAIPEHLFESEFFGHVKGAFTGAEQNKIGLVEAAHGGDLFLDEIEALPLTQQAKLLRFLETGEVRKVGSKESFHVNVRVISATNQNLETMVSEQKFRQDLLWRISGQKMILPALRERREDIPEMAQHFLDKERPRRNKTLSTDGIESLQKYNWPGNIRELKRVCEQISLTSPLPMIRAEDVEAYISRKPMQKSTSYDYTQGLDKLVEDFERSVCLSCLEQNNEDIETTIKILQISRSSLYKKIKKPEAESN